ncbi:MAG: multicopper oxidase family protein [Myxococcaceae bacterium]|nr:multicopper oxidase family protein [Myxococcaceae bacterium]
MTRIALFLLTIFLSAACSPGVPTDTSQPPGWDAQIAAPAAVDVDPSEGTVEVHLEAKLAQLELRPGVTTTVWTYNGQVPGPVIRAKKGQRLRVVLTNHLPEPTTIHWHGVRVPASMDGTPSAQAPVMPGETFTYSFMLLDAGTYWYHPHISSPGQVGAGLYGALIIEDPGERFFGDELVLVLSDISLEDDGSLSAPDAGGWFGDYFGREGDVKLVNGRVRPVVQGRVRQPQRWRMINASRSRVYKLQLPGVSWVRIAGDGGLIDRPQTGSFVLLSPGERAEIMLSPGGEEGARIDVLSLDADRFHTGTPMPPEPLFTLALTAPSPKEPLPLITEPLRTVEAIDTTQAPTRTIELMEKSLDGVGVLGINGKTTSESEPFDVKVNDTEVWELTNTTPYDHPFHLHGFFFQVLDSDGVPPAAREWKDTIIVGPKKHIRVAIHFDDRPGMWMFHCHILDHADLGMMAMFHVLP